MFCDCEFNKFCLLSLGGVEISYVGELKTWKFSSERLFSKGYIMSRSLDRGDR